MAFGQSSGPPATGKQVRELLELLEAAGHSDFRDARGPMGFTQRQAGGKFTRDEADEFIARLESEVHDDGSSSAPEPPRAGTVRPRTANVAPRPVPRAVPPEVVLDDVPAEQLAAELQRRGWIVVAP